MSLSYAEQVLVSVATLALIGWIIGGFIYLRKEDRTNGNKY